MGLIHLPAASTHVLPMLIVVSPLIGLATTAVLVRYRPALIRPMAQSNAAMTLLLTVFLVVLQPVGGPRDAENSRKVQSAPGIHWLAEAAAPAESATSAPLPLQGIRVRLSLAADGVSAWSALLLALVAWAILCVPDPADTPLFSAECMGLMAGQSALLASFFAADAIAAILFFECALLPIAFVIGNCGEAGHRTAAGGLWIWQLIGCSCSLLGTTLLAVSHPWLRAELSPGRGAALFDTALLAESIRQLLAQSELPWHLWGQLAPWGALLLLLGFLVRLPVFPLQGWYQSALITAPPAVSAMIAVAFPLAAIAGWLRLGMPLFTPNSDFLATILGAAGGVGALQAGFAASSQRDLKCLFALFSSALLCLVGVAISLQTRDGVRAAWLLVLSQGLATAGAMLVVQIVEAKLGTRDLDQLRRHAATAPRLIALLGLVLLGWVGIPIAWGFAGLYLQLSAGPTVNVGLIVGESLAIGAVSTSALRAFAQLVGHPASLTNPPAVHERADLAGADAVALAPILAILLLMNFAPAVVLRGSDPVLEHLSPRSDQSPATGDAGRARTLPVANSSVR